MRGASPIPTEKRRPAAWDTAALDSGTERQKRTSWVSRIVARVITARSGGAPGAVVG